MSRPQPSHRPRPHQPRLAFTQVHGPLDGTLLLEMEPGALRTEPTRQTDARPALAQRGGMLSARDRLVLNRFLIRGEHP